MSLYNELREKYTTFIYKNYTLMEQENLLVVKYFFEIPGLSQFEPKWQFSMDGHSYEELIANPTFMNMIFNLGMVELVSYWKIACPKNVIVEAGFLNEEQLSWWKELYFYGLGEFFYTNGIELDEMGFMDITATGTALDYTKAPLTANTGCLVPIGGGKDSVVSVELLRSMNEKAKCYIINPRGATVNTTKAGNFADEDVIVAKRTLDKRMIELNGKGFLNGHTPFSAIVAFSATIVCYLNNLKYITLSNEASANESTVLGSTVNHQYSKSFKFENDFHEYEKKYLCTGTYYFSLLRPLSEFQIARYFAKCTAYHDIFRSCNAGSKEDKWCGHCSKCLFVFLILSPFIGHDRLCAIFGTDMVNDKDMIPVMEQLVGVIDEKPFECVGSREEVNTAICMVIDSLKKQGVQLPLLYKHYMQLSQYQEYSNKKNEFFTSYEEENLLPDKFAKLIKENCCIA